MIRIAGVENDSIVDGEGLRLVVFFQGCPHHCQGCHNPETWDMDGGHLISLDEISDMIRDNPLLDGITISGGEPFMQAQAMRELSALAKRRGLNVWCYTGFRWEELIRAGMDIHMHDIDVLVDGRYERGKRTMELPFRGSSNQRVINVQKSLHDGVLVLTNSM